MRQPGLRQGRLPLGRHRKVRGRSHRDRIEPRAGAWPRSVHAAGLDESRASVLSPVLARSGVGTGVAGIPNAAGDSELSVSSRRRESRVARSALRRPDETVGSAQLHNQREARKVSHDLSPDHRSNPRPAAGDPPLGAGRDPTACRATSSAAGLSRQPRQGRIVEVAYYALRMEALQGARLRAVVGIAPAVDRVNGIAGPSRDERRARVGQGRRRVGDARIASSSAWTSRMLTAPRKASVSTERGAAHGRSAWSKKPTTRRSYSAGRALMPPTCVDSGISHSVADSPAAFA